MVDLELTRYYHCISRCVRRAYLCGEDYEHRKQWIEEQLELLASSFSASICVFSVMDNHLYLLVRLDPDLALEWSDEEVVKWWITVYTPRTLDMENPKVVQMWVDHHAQDTEQVGKYRQRLQDLGWLMKALKEPLARMANKLEESVWLCPVEDLRTKGSPREEMLEGFSLGSYLLLVDYTGRLYRNGKARMPRGAGRHSEPGENEPGVLGPAA